MIKVFNRTFSYLTHNMSRLITGPVTRLNSILESMLITGLLCLPLILYIWLTFFHGGSGGSGTAGLGLAVLPMREFIAAAQPMAQAQARAQVLVEALAQVMADTRPFTMADNRALIRILVHEFSQFLTQIDLIEVKRVILRMIRQHQQWHWHLNAPRFCHQLAALLVIDTGVLGGVGEPIQPHHIEGRHLLDQNPEIEANIQHNRATCTVMCGFLLYIVMHVLAAQTAHTA
jgi:hypothetical protein